MAHRLAAALQRNGGGTTSNGKTPRMLAASVRSSTGQSMGSVGRRADWLARWLAARSVGSFVRPSVGRTLARSLARDSTINIGLVKTLRGLEEKQKKPGGDGWPREAGLIALCVRSLFLSRPRLHVVFRRSCLA